MWPLTCVTRPLINIKLCESPPDGGLVPVIHKSRPTIVTVICSLGEFATLVSLIMQQYQSRTNANTDDIVAAGSLVRASKIDAHEYNCGTTVTVLHYCSFPSFFLFLLTVT